MTLEEVLQPGETMLAAPPAAEKQTPPPGEFNIYDWLIPDMVAIDRDGPKDNAPIPVVFEREIIDDLDQ
jgi:hypothetical protein